MRGLCFLSAEVYSKKYPPAHIKERLLPWGRVLESILYRFKKVRLLFKKAKTEDITAVFKYIKKFFLEKRSGTLLIVL